MTKEKKILRYIYTEDGEFLYDEKTMNYYSFSPPHKLIGNLKSKIHTESLDRL